MKKLTLAVAIAAPCVGYHPPWHNKRAKAPADRKDRRQWQQRNHQQRRYDKHQQRRYDKFGMRDSTTGMNARSGPERGSPDGSPATAPQATTGPNGQPSNNETLPK